AVVRCAGMADSMASLLLCGLTRPHRHDFGLLLDWIDTVEGQRERLDPSERLPVEEQPRHVGPRIMSGGIGSILGHADRAEIDLRDQEALLLRRQLLGDRAAIRSID